MTLHNETATPFVFMFTLFHQLFWRFAIQIAGLGLRVSTVNKHDVKFMHDSREKVITYLQHNGNFAHLFVDGCPWHTIHRPANGHRT